MLVLVTGAAGYVGAPTVARLLAAGHTVRGLDVLRFGGASLITAYTSGRFNLVRGDLRDEAAVTDALSGVDAVVHLAGIVGDPACSREPDLAREVNVHATLAVHAAARRAGVTRFVFASSCSVYGHGDQLADEHALLRPLSLYARTKADVEPHVVDGSAPMAGTVLRFATLYGLAPRMRLDLVVNTLAHHAVTRRRMSMFAPAAWRPLVHVDDVAAAIVSVVDAPAGVVAGQVFNVAAAAENHRLGDVAGVVAEVCGPGVAVTVSPDVTDARDYRVSGDKLTAATGWAPARSLRDGVREMAAALTAGVLDNVPGAGHVAA